MLQRLRRGVQTGYHRQGDRALPLRGPADRRGKFLRRVLPDAAGNLDGTACCGGAYNAGAVFKLDRTTGKETELYSFTGGADGGSSYAGLVRDKAGNLYGTTTGGGIYGQGAVFKLDATGQETVLYCFTGGDGRGTPGARLLRDNAGNLYGTTQYGGDLSCSVSFPPGCGVVFKLDPAGKETVLHSFTGPDGSLSFTGLVRDAAGTSMALPHSAALPAMEWCLR